MAGAITRGVLFVHSAPRALCPHVEWAAGDVLGARVELDWTPQPAAPGLFRAEYSWQGAQGTGARLASALRGWAHLRYEVTEDASHGADGSRWSHTPELGIFHAQPTCTATSSFPRTGSGPPWSTATTSSGCGWSSIWPSVRRGTTSWSHSATPAPARRCAGSTGSGDAPAARTRLRAGPGRW